MSQILVVQIPSMIQDLSPDIDNDWVENFEYKNLTYDNQHKFYNQPTEAVYNAQR